MPEEYEIEKLEDSLGEFIVYRTEDDDTEVHLKLRNGSVWMTQGEMAELFDIGVATVSRHLKAIFEDGDLKREATVSYYERVGLERGRQVTRRLEHYNLDAIMAVGYKVRGPRGAQFRNWATEVLTEYLVKGFVMNDEKLKDPTGADYFDELLERIRDIRASERRFYQQILEVVATATDYDKGNPAQRNIFAALQNKLHFAVAGQTAAEILETRCDPSQPNMGLTSFAGKKVRKKDVTVAKNYLEENEMRTLNRLTTMYLDHAQLQAERREAMTLKDWIAQTDKFIQFNDYPVLDNPGRVTTAAAKRHAEERYEIYDRARKKELEGVELQQQIEDMQRIEKEILSSKRRLGR